MNWSEKEVKALTELLATGFDFDQVALRMPHRSREAIIAKSRRIGLIPRKSVLPSDAELNDYISSVEYHSVAELERLVRDHFNLHNGFGAGKDFLRRLRRSGRIDYDAPISWTDERNNELIALCKQYGSAREVARVMNITEHNVRLRAHRLNISVRNGNPKNTKATV